MSVIKRTAIWSTVWCALMYLGFSFGNDSLISSNWYELSKWIYVVFSLTSIVFIFGFNSIKEDIDD